MIIYTGRIEHPSVRDIMDSFTHFVTHMDSSDDEKYIKILIDANAVNNIDIFNKINKEKSIQFKLDSVSEHSMALKLLDKEMYYEMVVLFATNRDIKVELR